MLTLNQARRLRRLICTHAQAQVDLSWAGSGSPEDAVGIKAFADTARLKLNNYITLLSTQEKK